MNRGSLCLVLRTIVRVDRQFAARATQCQRRNPPEFSSRHRSRLTDGVRLLRQLLLPSRLPQRRRPRHRPGAWSA
jgi:hypothetical protein